MKNNLISGAVFGIMALLIVVIGFAVIKPTVVVNAVNNALGAVSSPDIQSPYFSFGGVRFWGAHTETLKTATTTPCALLSPAATSTLMTASISFKVSSTTASTVTLAKATTAYATTTLLASAALAANAQGTLVASTTASGGATLDGTNVFGPSQWLVVGMAGGTGTFSPTGTCQAVWVQNAY